MCHHCLLRLYHRLHSASPHLRRRWKQMNKEVGKKKKTKDSTYTASFIDFTWWKSFTIRASLSLYVRLRVQMYQVMMPILHQILPAGCHRNPGDKIQSWCVDNGGMATETAAAGPEVKTTVFGLKDFELWFLVITTKKHQTSRIEGAALSWK